MKDAFNPYSTEKAVVALDLPPPKKHVGLASLMAQFEQEGLCPDEKTRELVRTVVERTLEAAQGQPGAAQALREGEVLFEEFVSKDNGLMRGTISIVFENAETMQRALDELDWVCRQDIMHAICVGKIVHDSHGVTASLNDYAMVTNQGQKLFTSKAEAVFAHYEELDKPDLWMRYEGDGQFGRHIEADEKTGIGYFTSGHVRELLGRRGVQVRKDTP